MNRILFLPAMLMITAVPAWCDSWSGKLIDGECYDKQKHSTGCEATSMTRVFAIEVAGKVYKLDPEGNEKAAHAIRNRADQAVDPSLPPIKDVNAKVNGSEAAGVIRTENVEVE